MTDTMNTTTAQTPAALTLASCLETILENVTNPEEFPQAEYDCVCGRLGITPLQAELFAAILELGISGDATAENVARKMGCSNLHFISHRKEIETLIAKRYVRCGNRGYRGITYRVPEEVIKSLQSNKVPEAEDIKGLSTSGIMRRMNNLYRDFWKDSLDLEALKGEIADILKYNEEDIFVKEYTNAGIDEMPECERLLFFFMATRRCAFNETEFGWEDFSKLFQDTLDEDYIHVCMDLGNLDLMESGIVEYANNEGIVDKSQLCFVEDRINKILAAMPNASAPVSSCRNIIGKSNITEKPLFYNEDEEKQIATLTRLLQEENYANVVARLKEKGMRASFCCLFHGKPGTGKTESVYQIARQTGRDIFLVDVSQLKSKWVGDSEKNVRALFQEYRSLVKGSEVAPILLFNEADAIFGVRKRGAEDSVDKMNNSIQNIILQEMETLEGIMIATTNLTENFDSAFERRFIYKVNFHKPDTEARTHIWESMVDGLEATSAEALARDFEFSGGQIENISRKATVNYILNGEQPSLDGLRELCLNETLTAKPKERARIGF